MSKTVKIFLLLTLGIIYLKFLIISQNTDMFFIIASGKDILNGNFYYNTYTNLPIIHQQWLYSVICALFDKLGIYGHWLFVFIQDIVLWYVSYRFINKKTKNNWSAIIIPIITIIICHNYMICIRPQIITMILLISELLVIEKYKENFNGKYLLWLLPISILEANLHQSLFLYHIFIMIPYLYNIEEKQIDWKLILISPFMVLSTLLTPYGLDGTLFIFKVAQSNVFDKVSINEVAPVKISSYIGIVLLIMLLTIILLNYKRKSNKYINFYVISVFILCLISVRHSILMMIPLLYLLVLIDFDKKKSIKGILVLMFLGTLWLLNTLNSPYNILTNEENKCICVEVLEEIPKDATIYNEMNLGNYLEYMEYENILFDVRPELYTYPLCEKDYFNDYKKFRFGFSLNGTLATDEEIQEIYNDYEYIIAQKVSYVNRILQNDESYSLINNENIWYNIYKQN